MSNPSNRKSLSISSIWAIAFLILIVISNLIIGSIVFSNWMASTQETAAKLAGHVNHDIMGKIDSNIQTPLYINEANHKILENGIFDLGNVNARDKFFVSVLSSANDEIYSFSYGTANGEYYGARRNKNGQIEIMRNNAGTNGQSLYYTVKDDSTAGSLAENAGKFDPRTRAWYKAAVTTGAPVFSSVYKHFVMDDLTISAAYPIYNQKGILEGVLGTHMLLSSLGNQLSQTMTQYQGYAFIVEKDSGYLIANSMNAANYSVLSDGTINRKTLDDLDIPAVQNAVKIYHDTDKNAYINKVKKGSYFIDIQEYNQAGLDWLIISALPKQVFTDELLRNIRIASNLTLVVCLFSFIFNLLVARRLFKPLKNLLHVSEKFSFGDLSQRAEIIRNDEIGQMSQSFNTLADNMQRLINNLEDTVALRTQELQDANEILSERENRLRLILDSTAEAIYGTDLSGKCTFCNKSCLKQLGYAHQEDLLDKNMHDMIHHTRKDGTAYPEEECLITNALQLGQSVYSNEEVLWRADGTCFDAEYRALPQMQNGERVGSVLTFMDITERKKDEAQIKYLSCHDTMTGLINRRCFEHELQIQDIDQNLPISLLFIDLNGLKMVNDTFGHTAGDELIIKAAGVIKTNCRETDTAARIGGDEFVVILPCTTSEEAEIISKRLKTQFSYNKVRVIPCSMAVGSSTKFKNFQSIENTLENAENQMYKDKTVSHKHFGTDIINSIISALHERNALEKRHSEEVAKLCGEIGLAMAWSETEIQKLRNAAYLHDIGKISLSETILSKKEKMYTETERETIRQHPAVGYRILNLSEDTMELADAVYAHHERWDGLGYPKGLKGSEIPLNSRIISIAETYERVRNNADYTAESQENALQIIREGAGNRFDPQMVEIFIHMIISR